MDPSIQSHNIAEAAYYEGAVVHYDLVYPVGCVGEVASTDTLGWLNNADRGELTGGEERGGGRGGGWGG